MAAGSRLAQLDGYRFVVRYSDGALEDATTAAEFASQAYRYLSELFGGVEPDVAVHVLTRADWPEGSPFGMPYYDRDEEDPTGVLGMVAQGGSSWLTIVRDIREASPRTGYPRLLAAYPDGAGGVDLQPFFDLITVHELAHAFQDQGDLRLPTYWLGEIFANLALHAFVATVRPEQLPALEVLPTVGAASRNLAARMRAEGFSTLEELDAHNEAISPANYAWYQHRLQRIAARVFDTDGEAALRRLWECFHRQDRLGGDRATADLSRLLSAEVSPRLGRAVRDWR